ncbi:MAG TPA: CBS domain-containing protein [Methylomirabilota bacterium]|nr:CBS domain-containing protein [Methylomirabilota bacterium]
MKVRDIMTPNPACCTPDDTPQRAALLMKNLDVGAIPIVDNEQDRKPLGIVTDRDLCCSVIARGLDPTTTRLADHMTTEPVCCRLDDDVQELSALMQERQIRRIPVVDEQGACCGIVAMADLALKAPREGKVEQTIQEVSEPASQVERQEAA